MKRDQRLIRDMLLRMEGGKGPWDHRITGPIVPPAARLAHWHWTLCHEAGYAAHGLLTHEGCELLDRIRDDRAFNAAVMFLERNGGLVTMPLICELLATFSKSPLAARRIELGLLQRDVADRAGLVCATISRCEIQNRLPQSLVAIRSYAAALDLTEDALRALIPAAATEEVAASEAPDAGADCGAVGAGACPQPTVAGGA